MEVVEEPKKCVYAYDVKMSEQRIFDSVVKYDAARNDNPYLLEVRNELNPKCKKCFGRGHVGRDFKRDVYIPCKCMYTKKTIEKPYETAKSLIESEVIIPEVVTEG